MTEASEVQALAELLHDLKDGECDHSMRQFHPSGRVRGYEDRCWWEAEVLHARGVRVALSPTFRCACGHGEDDHYSRCIHECECEAERGVAPSPTRDDLIAALANYWAAQDSDMNPSKERFLRESATKVIDAAFAAHALAPSPDAPQTVADKIGLGMLARVRLRGEPLTPDQLEQLVREAASLAPSPDALRAALEYALQRQVDLGTFSALRADEIIGDVYAALEPQERKA